MTYVQSKKRWKVVSSAAIHKEQIEGIAQPLSFNLSSTRSLLFIILQTNKDFEGGMLGDQIHLAQ